MRSFSYVCVRLLDMTQHHASSIVQPTTPTTPVDPVVDHTLRTLILLQFAVVVSLCICRASESFHFGSSLEAQNDAACPQRDD